MAKFEVEGTFSAVVEAENGRELIKLLQIENIKNPDNVEFKMIEVEEFWECEKLKENYVFSSI